METETLIKAMLEHTVRAAAAAVRNKIDSGASAEETQNFAVDLASRLPCAPSRKTPDWMSARAITLLAIAATADARYISHGDNGKWAAA
jgi:hypothetical protein